MKRKYTWLTKEALYRLYDDFDDKWIRDNDDGTYTLEISLPEEMGVWIYPELWLLCKGN